MRGRIARGAVSRNTPPYRIHAVATTSVPRRSRRRGCAAPGLPEGTVHDGPWTEWAGRLDTPKETARCPGCGATWSSHLGCGVRRRPRRCRPAPPRRHGPASTHAGCRRAVVGRREHGRITLRRQHVGVPPGLAPAVSPGRVEVGREEVDRRAPRQRPKRPPIGFKPTPRARGSARAGPRCRGGRIALARRDRSRKPTD